MYGQSVNNLVGERLDFTTHITTSATILTWLVAPVGIYFPLRRLQPLIMQQPLLLSWGWLP